jgi:hypothetical protein
MALGNMTLKYSQKKADGSTLNFTTAANGTTSELIGTAASSALAEQQIKDQIQVSIDKNQGNVDDQTAAKAAFG